MYIEPTAIGHPTQRQLLAFAESLVDRHTPVSALLATHVANCPSCAREVKRIRASFKVAALARLPEPSQELTQRIIARAQHEHRKRGRIVNTTTPWARCLQVAACLVGITALAYFSYSVVLNDITLRRSALPGMSGVVAEAQPQPDTTPLPTENMQALADAVSLQQETFASPSAVGHRRALEALDQDMSAALAALERNPGCPRANQVMQTSMARQLEGLRNLYLDRKL